MRNLAPTPPFDLPPGLWIRSDATQQTAGLIIVINGATTPKVIEPPTIDVTPQRAMKRMTADGSARQRTG
jgi:hypothetical protein